MHERPLIPKFALSFLMKGALRWMPNVSSISLCTLVLHVGWFSFPERTCTFRTPFTHGVPCGELDREMAMLQCEQNNKSTLKECTNLVLPLEGWSASSQSYKTLEKSGPQFSQPLFWFSAGVFRDTPNESFRNTSQSLTTALQSSVEPLLLRVVVCCAV